MKKIIFLILFASFLSVSSFAQDSAEIRLNLKIFLQGPFHGNKMNADLESKNLIPLHQPYNTLPWSYKGNETVEIIPDGVVDWILVELSKAPDETSVTNRQACFLNTNGYVIDINNREGITLNVHKNEKYYIIVHHRNHLSVISAIPLILSGNVSYDFTESDASAYGVSSLVELGDGIYGVPTGDCDGNGIINSMDFKAIAENIFDKGYNNCDLDMNGVVNVLDYGQTNINISKKSYIPAKSTY